MYVTGFYLLSLITGCYGLCTDTNVDSTKVATMCSDSAVSGTQVYIDAGLAKCVSSKSGLVCSCSVKADLASMNITTYYGGIEGSDCGATLSYVADGQPSRNVSCKKDQFEISSKNMVANVFKIKPPYDSNYCAKFQLIYCDSTEFRCSDGTCIHGSGRCDNQPDCADGSDEDNCSTVTCLEGQVVCDDGSTCIDPNQRCNGISDCPNGSDEPANCGSTTSNTLQSTLSPTTPLITVTCTKSLHSGEDPPSKAGSCFAGWVIAGVVGLLIIIVVVLCVKARKNGQNKTGSSGTVNPNS